MNTFAYAKINLGLRILRKRDDGYHDIETVFHRISLADALAFESSSTISLSCNRHEVPTDDANLCVRAAGLLQKKFGIQNGVHIGLKKHIPVGAGLGGGSSDAAAVLRALPGWWNKPISDEELQSLAVELGADVPYFLNSGTAYATGKGEHLEYFDLDVPYWVVVVYPNVHISTTWAYKNVKLAKPAPTNRRAPLKEIILDHLHTPRMLINLLQNDFEPLILRAYPIVAETKKALYDGGAVFAQMSGSGSSVYAFFDDERLANDTSNRLGLHHQVFRTPAHFRPAK